ncbi:MAG TPA: tRNA (adenosine(37)-N6)-threonylcarbamoyltransferase complex transferase subunit TsaD [Candidatus Moranbacteria bacterium]|nr:tRNA (adenosine(37)-N6)-threonylcarbamoyltransferase complex transferase subunit TsaD [Candidatus Moranbacteria bacterium]
MIILGIETTCDETAASIIKAEKGKIDILSNIVSSQIELHAKWGGVVPNLAAREHLKNIIPVLKEALEKSKKTPGQIDLISVANGPGLIPALLIGVNAAKTLSYIWEKPLIGVHHIEGHIYANFINEIRSIPNPQLPVSKKLLIKFPVLCLVVSGGHTQLVLIKKHLDYQIIGETLDDAAGEAFDKVARILGLSYPGGPAVAAYASAWTSDVRKGHVMSIDLPRPMINSKDFNFSFSGLKTAVLYETKKHPEFLKNKNYISGICHEFQQSVCDVLISKTIKAAAEYRPKTIMLAGGVSANRELRNQLGTTIEKKLGKTLYRIPEIKYCADNAAMIAAAGFYRWKKIGNRKKLHDNWKTLSADANLKL